MFFTNAVMQRKENYYEESPCFIEKVIHLESTEYNQFSLNLLRDYPFIEDNKDLMFKASDGWHCLLVLPIDGTDGILIESEGSSYARYSSFLPNASMLIENQNQVQNHKNSQTVTKEVNFYCPLTIQSDADGSELYEISYAEALPY